MGSQADRQLWQLTASEVLPKLRNGELKVEDYVQALLRRIQSRDQDVKAFVYLSAIQVLQEARRLDDIPPSERGPLHGLPIAIKDIVLTKDMPTQYNSPMYQTQIPIATDANCVASLRAAGAIIFGKTSTTEFATSRIGAWHQNHTTNAIDAKRTPGGSSSGSGAAVGDFQVPVALGTQTGGSVIRPASFNGCFGLKPTFGAISRDGVSRWSDSLDTCGFFARAVQDFDILLDLFRLQDDRAVPEEPFKLEGARFGFCKTAYWPNAGPGTQKAMERAKEILKNHGAEIDDVELPAELDGILDWHSTLISREGQTSFLGQYLSNKKLIHEPRVVGYVENSQGISRAAQLQALDNSARARSIFDKIAVQYAAIITPSIPDEAPNGLESTGDMNFCSTWTLLHVPALNIPGFAGENGLPIGLTAVGPRFTDRHLLHVAKSLAPVFRKEGGWISHPSAGAPSSIGVRRMSSGYRSRPSLRS